MAKKNKISGIAKIDEKITQELEDHRMAWCGFIIEALRQYNDNLGKEDEGKTLYATYLDMMIRWYPQIDQEGQDSYGKFAAVRNSVEASTDKEKNIILCQNLKFSDDGFLQMLSGQGRKRSIHFEHNPPVKQIREWLTIGFKKGLSSDNKDEFNKQLSRIINSKPVPVRPSKEDALIDFCWNFVKYSNNNKKLKVLKEKLYKFLISEKYSVLILSKNETNKIENRKVAEINLKENGNYQSRLTLSNGSTIIVNSLFNEFIRLQDVLKSVESDTHEEVMRPFFDDIISDKSNVKLNENNQRKYKRKPGANKMKFWFDKYLKFWQAKVLPMHLDSILNKENTPNTTKARRYNTKISNVLSLNQIDVFNRLLISFYWLIISKEDLIKRFEDAAK